MALGWMVFWTLWGGNEKAGVVEGKFICQLYSGCFVVEESLTDGGDVVKVQFDQSPVAVFWWTSWSIG